MQFMQQIDWQMIQQYIVTYGLKVLLAIITLIIGKWLSRRIAKVCTAILERQNVDLTLTRFLNNIVYYVLLIAVIIAAAGQLGINTASFLTVLGAASLAVGLALKDSLSNFASGVMLILFRPFRIGDAVTVAGETGKVIEITVFNTIIHTGDNQKKIIPNGAISNSTITNITANPTRRIDLVIGVSYDDDIRKVKAVLETIINAESRILTDPKPVISLLELADSSVNMAVRPWVKTEDYWDVYFALMENIKLTFDEEQISFPYPQSDVYLHSVDAKAV